MDHAEISRHELTCVIVMDHADISQPELTYVLVMDHAEISHHELTKKKCEAFHFKITQFIKITLSKLNHY